MIIQPTLQEVKLLTAGGGDVLTHSLSFNGTTDGLEILDGSQTGLDVSGDFTYETWIQPDSLPSVGGLAGIFIKEGVWGGVSNRAFQWSLWNSGGTQKIRIDVSQNGSTFDEVTWDVTLATSTWSHLAVTCDISEAAASQFELFVNTVSQGNGTVTSNAGVSSINNSGNPFNLAFYHWDDSPDNKFGFFAGHLADARLWNGTIRTGAQIAANWKTLLADGTSGLTSSWRLTDGSGTTAADTITASGNTLSFIGSPTWSTDVPWT